jgi:hypothetical protein
MVSGNVLIQLSYIDIKEDNKKAKLAAAGAKAAEADEEGDEAEEDEEDGAKKEDTVDENWWYLIKNSGTMQLTNFCMIGMVWTA